MGVNKTKAPWRTWLRCCSSQRLSQKASSFLPKTCSNRKGCRLEANVRHCSAHSECCVDVQFIKSNDSPPAGTYHLWGVCATRVARAFAPAEEAKAWRLFLLQRVGPHLRKPKFKMQEVEFHVSQDFQMSANTLLIHGQDREITHSFCLDTCRYRHPS